MKCLECGHDLNEMRREVILFTVDDEKPKFPWQHWKDSHTVCAGHCRNCLCDWEWDEWFAEGKFGTTQPSRIFWG